MTQIEQLRQRLRSSKALIFDFDGTLAPNLDLPDMKRQVIELTLAAGVPESVFADAFIVEIVNLASTWLDKQETKRGQQYQKNAHKLIEDIEMASAHDTDVFAATPELLSRWRTLGGFSAIVTRNCRAAVMATYPDAQHSVDAVLARDDVPHLKPDARHLQQALSALNITAQQAIMIGDGAMDMQIGADCGTYNVGVLSGSSNAARLEAAGAHCVFTDITCFLSAMDSL